MGFEYRKKRFPVADETIAYGSDLASGWDFTVGWGTTASAAIVDADTFTAAASGHGITSSGAGTIGSNLTAGKVFRMRLAGTVDSGTLRIRDSSVGTTYKDVTGVFDETFFFTSAHVSLYFQSLSGAYPVTVDITTFVIKENIFGYKG